MSEGRVRGADAFKISSWICSVAGSALAFVPAGFGRRICRRPQHRRHHRVKVHRVFIPLSQSVTIEVNANLGDLVIADNKIADAQPMTDRSLYIIGKGVGTTSINLFSDDKRSLGVIEVEVGVDVDDMATAIRQVAPSSRITIGTVNGKVRLGGRVKDGATLAKILDVAQQYGAEAVINAIDVEDSQQVNLEVRVLEVSRNAGRELGVSWLTPIIAAGRGVIGNGVYLTARPLARIGAFATGNAPFATLIANVSSTRASMSTSSSARWRTSAWRAGWPSRT